MFGCLDQLDMFNLHGVEAICRTLQYQEHEIHKKLEAKRADNSKNMEWFLGRAKRIGNPIISPELVEWVAKKAASESTILKEQRKAAEERALQAANKKGAK